MIQHLFTICKIPIDLSSMNVFPSTQRIASTEKKTICLKNRERTRLKKSLLAIQVPSESLYNIIHNRCFSLRRFAENEIMPIAYLDNL